VLLEVSEAFQDESRSGLDLLSLFTQRAKEVAVRDSFWTSAYEVAEQTQMAINERLERKTQPCVRTGFAKFDQVTGGLPPTLCAMLAMPGVGKSAWLASVLRHCAQGNVTTATFSMEDRSEWLSYRLLSHESAVPQFVLRNQTPNEAEWSAIGEGFDKFKRYAGRILLDDRPSLRPAEVLYSARHAVRELGAKLVTLDNITAMRFTRGPRMDLEIQDFLCDARSLADELKVPFLVLSHVKRRDGLGPGDMPRLTDASESSAFEKLTRFAFGLARKPDSDVVTLGVIKNTNGRTGEFVLSFAPKSALVTDTPKAAPWNYSDEVKSGTF
jgi:replicative DNA helicase